MLKERIRVLHIIKSLGRGGAEMLLPETLKVHDRSLFEFHFIYFLPWKHQMVEELERAGGIVSCFSSDNNIEILLNLRRVIKYVRSHKIDLIHCHLPWAGFLGRFVHKLIGVPLFYTEHNEQQRYHWITFLLNKTTFNWQDRVIAVSNEVERSIRSKINPSIKVETILNGVNTRYFVRDIDAGLQIRQRHGIPNDAVIVGTVAVFRFQKRLAEWMEVAKSVADVNDNVYFIIVGDGPLKQELISKQNELNLGNRLLMVGIQEDVKPWLSAMDIYMMTSQFEGLPIALLEAMSMECTVATTDAGGIKQLVTNDECGIVVPVAEWKNLKAGILGLLNDPAKRIRFGKAARQRVKEEFSLDRMVASLETSYKDQLAR